MRSENLVRDIHLLGRRYHWSEPDILPLRLKRRKAYLGLLEEEAHATLIQDGAEVEG